MTFYGPTADCPCGSRRPYGDCCLGAPRPRRNAAPAEQERLLLAGEDAPAFPPAWRPPRTDRPIGFEHTVVALNRLAGFVGSDAFRALPGPAYWRAVVGPPTGSARGAGAAARFGVEWLLFDASRAACDGQGVAGLLAERAEAHGELEVAACLRAMNDTRLWLYEVLASQQRSQRLQLRPRIAVAPDAEPMWVEAVALDPWPRKGETVLGRLLPMDGDDYALAHGALSFGMAFSAAVYRAELGPRLARLWIDVMRQLQ